MLDSLPIHVIMRVGIMEGGAKMSKRITSLEDLAKIAGAELGKKQIDSEIERLAAEDGSVKKPCKPILVTSKKLTKSKKPSKSKTSDTVDRPLYNAFETRTIDQGPYGLTNIDDARAEPNPINGYTRTLKKKDLPKKIEDQKARIKLFTDIYLEGIKRGENNTGYVWVTIGIARDIERMEKWLVELEEKA